MCCDKERRKTMFFVWQLDGAHHGHCRFAFGQGHSLGL
jgi:hypothetical protein